MMREGNWAAYKIAVRVFKSVVKMSPWASTGILVLILWASANTALGLHLTQAITDSAFHAARTHTGFWFGPVKWLVLSLVLGAVNQVVQNTRYWLQLYAEKRTRMGMQMQLMDASSQAPISAFENTEFIDSPHRDY